MFKQLTVLALAVAAAARKCHNVTVPISISSQNAVFDLKAPTTEIEVSNFFLRFTRQGSDYSKELQKGYRTIQGDYEIAGTYCEPDSGPGHALQIMTHGVGFDRSYWDIPFHNHNYSYVARAVDEHGYSTFTWDRLGVGQSSRGEPVNEIQVHLEIAALKELTARLAEGQVCGVGAKFPPGKTVHIGHSFGSVMTYNLVNQNPGISGAVVLTGFSQIPNFMDQFALGGNFAPVSANRALAASYPAGYIAPASSIGMHINFLSPGEFDPQMLEYASATGQPASPGELLTVGAGTSAKNAFAGPVMIITGEYDVPFCGGDCKGMSGLAKEEFPNLIAASAPFFDKASVFNATVVPSAGHSLNMAYSMQTTYAMMLDFIGRYL
ncbi:hypothetical protein ESCO_001426 [Escovopsis weberi]|uniref:AB hydrolase-1 domain-containing protein n=1 Tax=Escovopsis weberi TaxID=150374 RepID=A0A0M8N7U5_ESCWE|nr:hypothetical protein ESCO_001426 [Escovopsis weberi]